jgi:hypothetical protein
LEAAEDEKNGAVNRADHEHDGNDKVKDKERRVTAGFILALEEVHARES